LHDFGGNLFSENFVFALRRSRRVNGNTGQQDCGEGVFQDFFMMISLWISATKTAQIIPRGDISAPLCR
jgi:hypothetical protein